VHTGFRQVISKKAIGIFGIKPIEKKQQKPVSNLIKFQFIMPVVSKDFFMPFCPAQFNVTHDSLYLSDYL